jgi:hypothetical protein
MGKSALIAVVMVTTWVAGQRVDFQPGDELPEMNEHDTAQLKAMGAVRDPDDEAKEARADAKDQREADKAYQTERGNVLAAEESTKVPPLAVPVPSTAKSTGAKAPV